MQNVMITTGSGKDVYYVSEYEKPIDKEVFNNPFKNGRSRRYEKIADAIVGNLKDYVVVNEKKKQMWQGAVWFYKRLHKYLL